MSELPECAAPAMQQDRLSKGSVPENDTIVVLTFHHVLVHSINPANISIPPT
jgi:hypothetical protein